jgi:hypothetical protein
MTASSAFSSFAALPAIAGLASVPGAVAFVSGSHLAGYGTHRSDYDVGIVYPNGPGPVRHGPRKFVTAEGARVDLVAHTLDEIRAAADLVNACLRQETAIAGLRLATLQLYYRVAIGRPLANPAGFSALQALCTPDIGAAVYRLWSARRCGAQLVSARYRLSIGDEREACQAAGAALLYAVNTAAAAQGDGYPSEKVLLVKAKRHLSPASYERVWSLKAPGARPIAEYLNDVTAACTTLCGEAGISALPAAPRAAKTARLFTIRTKHYLVQQRARVYELDPAAVPVWHTIEAVGERPLVAASGEAVIDPSVARVALAELARHGLLQVDDTPVLPVLPAACDEVPRYVKLLPRSPAELASSLVIEARAIANCRAAVSTLAGVTENGWAEAAASCATMILDRGVQAYVARGGVLAAPGISAFSGLAALCGEGSGIYRRGWALATRNPPSAHAAAAHAWECLSFVEEALGVPVLAGWWRRGEREMPATFDVEAWPAVLGFAEYLNVDPLAVPLATLQPATPDRTSFG